MTRISLPIGFVATCALTACFNWSICVASPAPVPKETVKIGIVQPVGQPERAALAREIFQETLESYGFKVQRLEPVEDPWRAFTIRPDLDFLVKCILDGQSASARVFDSQSETVRRLESRDKDPIRDLAAKVLRHISSQSSLEAVVAKRKQRAAAMLQQNPRDYQSLVLMGLALYHESDFDQAVRCFEDAIKVNRLDPDAYYNLALCHENLGHRARAVEQLEKALDLDPNHEGASIALANAHLRADRFHEAIAVYNRWLDSPRNASLAHWNLAVAYNRKGDPRQALFHLRQIDRSDLQYVRAQKMVLDLSAALPNVGQESLAGGQRGDRTDDVPTREARSGPAIAFVVIAVGIVAIGLAFGGVALVRSRSSDPRTDSKPHDTHGEAGLDDTVTSLDVACRKDRHRIGDYRLIAMIGRGGMGTVYKAAHRHLDKVVALKMVSPQRCADDRSLARFQREMRAVGRLDHPGIVRATDAGEADGVYYLVTDYVDGMDLASLVRQVGPLAVSEACEIIRQVATALEYAHDHGLVHRDIKPSNLILARDGTVKMLDLGLAHLQDEPPAGEALTQTGQVIGTPDYMAPEQAAGGQEVDRRSDIYSLGCTLYTLLSGRGPFSDSQHATPTSKAIAHVQESIPPIRQLRSDVGEELIAVLDRMLAKSPDDRFQNATTVAEALASFAVEADLAGLLSTGSVGPAERANTSRPQR